jgi:hypothetical protein
VKLVAFFQPQGSISSSQWTFGRTARHGRWHLHSFFRDMRHLADSQDLGGVFPLRRSLWSHFGHCDRLSYCPVPFLDSMRYAFRFSTRRCNHFARLEASSTTAASAASGSAATPRSTSASTTTTHRATTCSSLIRDLLAGLVLGFGCVVHEQVVEW